MKLKHNKKRNTAFLYEMLIKHYTIASINKDKEMMMEIKNVIRSFFSKGKPLSKELTLFRNITETNGADSYTAKRLFEETVKEHEELDGLQIFNEQTKLINWINKNIGQDSFNIFMPNYKSLASIAQIFDDKNTTREKIILEKKVISMMMSKPQIIKEMKLEPMDNLVYKTVVKNFNNKYADTLLEEQKKLLQHFVLSFQDEGIGFVSYVNGEISRIKEALENYSGSTETKEKMNLVLEMVNDFRNRPIDREMLEKVMKLQGLAKEITNDGNND